MPAFPHHLAYTSPYRGGSTELSSPGNHYSGETASVKDVVANGRGLVSDRALRRSHQHRSQLNR